MMQINNALRWIAHWKGCVRSLPPFLGLNPPTKIQIDGEFVQRKSTDRHSPRRETV